MSDVLPFTMLKASIFRSPPIKLFKVAKCQSPYSLLSFPFTPIALQRGSPLRCVTLTALAQLGEAVMGIAPAGPGVALRAVSESRNPVNCEWY